MGYLPKSKFSIKNTQGGELVYKSNLNKYYIGDYIFTSRGKYYAGTDSTNLKERLILKPEDEESIEKMSNDFSKDVIKHKIFKKSINNFLSKTEPIPLSKPTPTEEDYERGYFSRYFAKKINEDLYIEINEKDIDKKS